MRCALPDLPPAICSPHSPSGKHALMDIFTAMQTRRSVPSYAGESVSDENVRNVLEAAMLASSEGNERP